MTDLIFSIIIPVYNAETTIRRCLDSFTNQRFSDYEILLINDGSTDNSDAICRAYADVNSKICYLSKENGGVSSARNLGLEQAKGEYALFVDSDDYVSEDYFDVINQALTQRNPDLLMFGYRNVGSISAERGTGEFYEDDEVGAAKRISFSMRQYLFSSLWSKVFKRKIIKNNGLRFRTDLSIGEDQLFIFSYAMHIRSISSIDALLYNVDVSNENSLSRKGRHYLTGQLMEVNRRMYAAYHATEHSPESAHYYEAGLAWMTYRSAYSCCKELLKFNCSAKQRRREIRKICKLYRAEKIKPVGWKCWCIALPVRMRWSRMIDLLICCKSKRRSARL